MDNQDSSDQQQINELANVMSDTAPSTHTASESHTNMQQVTLMSKDAHTLNLQIAQSVVESMRKQPSMYPTDYQSKKAVAPPAKCANIDGDRETVSSDSNTDTPQKTPVARNKHVTLASRKPGAKPFGVGEQRQDGRVTYNSKTNIITKQGTTVYLLVGKDYDDMEMAAKVRDIAAMSMGANDGARLNYDADYYTLRMVEHLVSAVIEENSHLFSQEMLLTCLARAAAHGVEDDLAEHHPFHTMLFNKLPLAITNPAMPKLDVKARRSVKVPGIQETAQTDWKATRSRFGKRTGFLKDTDIDMQEFIDEPKHKRIVRRKRKATALAETVVDETSSGQSLKTMNDVGNEWLVLQGDDATSSSMQDNVRELEQARGTKVASRTSKHVRQADFETMTRQGAVRPAASEGEQNRAATANLLSKETGISGRKLETHQKQGSRSEQGHGQQKQVPALPPSKETHQRLGSMRVHGNNLRQTPQQTLPNPGAPSTQVPTSNSVFDKQHQHQQAGSMKSTLSAIKAAYGSASAVVATDSTQNLLLQHITPSRWKAAGPPTLPRAVFAPSPAAGSDIRATAAQSTPKQPDIVRKGIPIRGPKMVVIPHKAAAGGMHPTYTSASLMPVSSLALPHANQQLTMRVIYEPAPPVQGTVLNLDDRGATGGSPVNNPSLFAAGPASPIAFPTSPSYKPWLPR